MYLINLDLIINNISKNSNKFNKILINFKRVKMIPTLVHIIKKFSMNKIQNNN